MLKLNYWIGLLLLALNIGPWHSPESMQQMEEICDNAIDDDDDGFIDLNDDDCSCEIIEPVSLIPNPSFEEMTCCPSNRSQLECADVWIQASEPTTDYLHTCGWIGWPEFPPPRPFPDGLASMGFRDGRVRGSTGEAETNWKEYAGACLISPLKAGTNYRFEFEVGFVNSLSSPPIDVTFFGTSDCTNLPFGVGDDAFGCPTNGPNWVALGSVRVFGSNNWVNTFIEVTPSEDMKAIAIGPPCEATSASVSTYYFFDNLILADLRSFQFKIEEINHPCSNNFLLEVKEFPGLEYQWYKDGIALLGETDPQLTQIYGEGDFQVRILEGSSCKLSKVYPYTIPVLTSSIEKIICKEDFFSFDNKELNLNGQYIDTLQSVNSCDSIVTLNLRVLGDIADTVQATIFEGQEYVIEKFRFKKEDDYLVELKSYLGCDSLVLLQLEHYKVYIPNVFSPNQDNINDYFQAMPGDDLLDIPQMQIFDRWGNLLYEGEQWDGRFKGQLVNSGVYVYIIRFQTNDGEEWEMAGSVTVLR